MEWILYSMAFLTVGLLAGVYSSLQKAVSLLTDILEELRSKKA